MPGSDVGHMPGRETGGWGEAGGWSAGAGALDHRPRPLAHGGARLRDGRDLLGLEVGVFDVGHHRFHHLWRGWGC